MGYNKKYYVVWQGRQPGVYDDLSDAMEQVEDYPGAAFKGYDSAGAAAEAYRQGCRRVEQKELGNLLNGVNRNAHTQLEANKQLEAQRTNMPRAGVPDYMSFPEIDLNGWAVDAACAGNPGKMEYRGVSLLTGEQIFHVGPFVRSTNNIGEFLAIVHALALMFQRGETHTIYSDSKTGMAWVRDRKVKTQLARTPQTEPSFRMMERALSWLNTHQVDAKILKWNTDKWGEIPADFGRKG